MDAANGHLRHLRLSSAQPPTICGTPPYRYLARTRLALSRRTAQLVVSAHSSLLRYLVACTHHREYSPLCLFSHGEGCLPLCLYVSPQVLPIHAGCRPLVFGRISPAQPLGIFLQFVYIELRSRPSRHASQFASVRRQTCMCRAAGNLERSRPDLKQFGPMLQR